MPYRNWTIGHPGPRLAGVLGPPRRAAFEDRRGGPAEGELQPYLVAVLRQDAGVAKGRQRLLRPTLHIPRQASAACHGLNAPLAAT